MISNLQLARVILVSRSIEPFLRRRDGMGPPLRPDAPADRRTSR
jgi:hypothetical protein